MCEFETRWSADHCEKIEIGYAEDSCGLDWVFEDLSDAGCEVFSTDPVIRSAFRLADLPLEDEAIRDHQRQMKKTVLDAYRQGDHVFFMVHGEHSYHSFWFQDSGAPRPRFSDSWICGFSVVRRKAWREFFPNRPASRWVVRRWLDRMASYVEAQLNGWIYEAAHTDKHGCCSCLTGFLSPEEALEEALREFPECRFSEDDFERSVSYRLRGSKSRSQSALTESSVL